MISLARVRSRLIKYFVAGHVVRVTPHNALRRVHRRRTNKHDFKVIALEINLWIALAKPDVDCPIRINSRQNSSAFCAFQIIFHLLILILSNRLHSQVLFENDGNFCNNILWFYFFYMRDKGVSGEIFRSWHQ